MEFQYEVLLLREYLPEFVLPLLAAGFVRSKAVFFIQVRRCDRAGLFDNLLWLDVIKLRRGGRALHVFVRVRTILFDRGCGLLLLVFDLLLGQVVRHFITTSFALSLGCVGS